MFQYISNMEKRHSLHKSLGLLAVLLVIEVAGCREQEIPPDSFDYDILGPLQTDLGLGNAQQLTLVRGYFPELGERGVVNDFVIPPEQIPQIEKLMNEGTPIQLQYDEAVHLLLKAENASGESKFIQVFEVSNSAVIEFERNYYLIGPFAPLYNRLLEAVRSPKEAR